jgi:hypothetical protein
MKSSESNHRIDADRFAAGHAGRYAPQEVSSNAIR